MNNKLKTTKVKSYPVYRKSMSKFMIEEIGNDATIIIRCKNCGSQWSPSIFSGGKLSRKWWLCYHCGIQQQIVDGEKV